MAQADIPNKVLELDGNSTTGDTCVATGTSPKGCDDWNLLNGTGSGGANAGGAKGNSLARAFISEPAGLNIFQGGGSKDPIDIPSWKWKSGSTPDKDAITNGYAAAYQAPSGHLILTFGADRFAVNGDANIGLWFFQQNVAPVGSTSGGFSGVHVNNDIFIVSAFTQGGGISTITVYLWDDTCSKGVSNATPGQCADSNLRLRFVSPVNAINCTAQAEGCAFVNGIGTPGADAQGGIQVSWPYLAKFGSQSTVIPAGGFYEGGLDVTELLSNLGGNLPCFTSFLIETRSSQTPSAVLKDFVGGNFNICKADITKTCGGNGALNAGGTSIHYLFNGTVTNSGIGALNHMTIVDSLPAGSTNVAFKAGAPLVSVISGACPASGYPSGTTCADIGSVAAGGVVNWSVEFDSTALNVQNSASARGSSSSSAPGACTASGTTCTTTDGLDHCSTAPTNSITVSKNCGVPTGYPNATLPSTQLVTSGSVAAVQVNFSGIITNTGQTPLSGVTLTDNPAATITVAWPDPTKPGVIPAGGGSAKYSGSYLPSGVTAGDLGGAAGRYSFVDEIKVIGATATLGSSPGHDITCTSTFGANAQACGGATCNICPAGATCSGN